MRSQGDLVGVQRMKQACSIWSRSVCSASHKLKFWIKFQARTVGELMTMCVAFCWSDLYALCKWMKRLFSCSPLWKKRAILSLGQATTKRLRRQNFCCFLTSDAKFNEERLAKCSRYNSWRNSIRHFKQKARALDDLMLLMMHFANRISDESRAFILSEILPKSKASLASGLISVCSKFHQTSVELHSEKSQNKLSKFDSLIAAIKMNKLILDYSIAPINATKFVQNTFDVNRLTIATGRVQILGV